MLAAAAGIALTYVLEPRLPEQIATHWSGDTPDGFMSPTSSAWMVALILLLVGGGCCAIAALAQAQLMMRRMMLLVGLVVVGLILAVEVAMIVGQLDATSVVDTPLPTTAIGVGAALGAVVGLLGASLLRDHRVRTVATEPPAAVLPRGAVELPITDQVGMSAGLAGVALVVAAPAIGVSYLAGAWWPLALFLPAVLLLVTLLQFRVLSLRRRQHPCAEPGDVGDRVRHRRGPRRRGRRGPAVPGLRRLGSQDEGPRATTASSPGPGWPSW